jgi:VanZ family protein
VNGAFYRYHLPAILWAVAIFVFSSIPGTSIPNFSIFSQDKALHAAVFFVFAFLLYRSFSIPNLSPSRPRRAGLWTLAVASLYGVFDEVHQLFVTGRSSDYRDVLADVVGALAFLLLVWFRDRLRRKAQRA